jgi:microcystin-dependent protein
VGSIFYFASNSPPDGFLECNGVVLSPSIYPALTTLLGTTFGAYGQLPDLRNEFIRGWNHSRTGIDDENRNFGSWQNQDTLPTPHRHYTVANVYVDGFFGNWIGDRYLAYNGGHNGWHDTQYALQPTVIEPTGGLTSLPISAPGVGIETRPRNIALLPCIKY